MSSFSIIGFWKFRSNRIRSEDGTWFEEKLTGGTMAFSHTGDAVLLVRSAEQGVWGYVGRYTFSNGKTTIQIEASTTEGLDGHILSRDIEVINANEFIFSGSEVHTGRKFETNFVRVV